MVMLIVDVGETVVWADTILVLVWVMVVKAVEVLIEETSVVIIAVTAVFWVTTVSTVVVEPVAAATLLLGSCRATSCRASATSGEACSIFSMECSAIAVGTDRLPLALSRLVVTVTYCQFVSVAPTEVIVDSITVLIVEVRIIVVCTVLV